VAFVGEKGKRGKKAAMVGIVGQKGTIRETQVRELKETSV